MYDFSQIKEASEDRVRMRDLPPSVPHTRALTQLNFGSEGTGGNGSGNARACLLLHTVPACVTPIRAITATIDDVAFINAIV